MTHSNVRHSARILALLVALLATLVLVPSALANFGPHSPASVVDNDTCAMCHRIHSSSSAATWDDPSGNAQSGLLVGSSATITEFCCVCHGDGTPGASTNVIAGVFEGTSAYETSSTPGAPLISGGFGQMPDPYAWDASATIDIVPTTSRHDLDTGPLPLWGSGATLTTIGSMSCSSCHDPHPTSNYRMLRGEVNSMTVGGYTGAEDSSPNAFVFSTETGYPIPGVDASNTAGGFLKGAAGQAQVDVYRPDYTGNTQLLNITSTDADKSLSVWCSSCHTGYRQTSAATTVTTNFEIYEANPVTGDQVGALDRHFHPVDVTLENGYGPSRSLPSTVGSDPHWIPLEKASSGSGDYWKNYIGCMTCHRAHGTSTVMSGWGASHLETNTLGYWTPVQDGVPGVSPDKQVAGGSSAVGSSALIRTNNRGICERCHGG